MSRNPPAGDGADNEGDREPFRARALMASLTVKDIGKSLAWYHEVMGFVVTRRFEREGTLFAVSLAAGEVRILIGQDDGAKGWDRIKGEGISLQIITDQVDALAGRIKARGGNLASEPIDTPWGTRMFRVHDPDGFKLTIASA